MGGVAPVGEGVVGMGVVALSGGSRGEGGDTGEEDVDVDGDGANRTCFELTLTSPIAAATSWPKGAICEVETAGEMPGGVGVALGIGAPGLNRPGVTE